MQWLLKVLGGDVPRLKISDPTPILNFEIFQNLNTDLYPDFAAADGPRVRDYGGRCGTQTILIVNLIASLFSSPALEADL